MIRKMEAADLPKCADILCAVYNNELWQGRWDAGTAVRYLSDFFYAGKAVCFAAEDSGSITGAIFCREKVWWNNSELVVEEMFVRPEMQRQGFGTALLKKAEEYVTEKSLAGITLLTNRFAPAPAFYKKNGFAEYNHVLCMGKVL
jgi:aminoglycoside 6'-N-acetyltransferase I